MTDAGRAFLRPLHLERTFRLFKQTLGWTWPRTRTPSAAARWTRLVMATHTQLHLARPLVADLRHLPFPCQSRSFYRPLPIGRMG